MVNKVQLTVFTTTPGVHHPLWFPSHQTNKQKDKRRIKVNPWVSSFPLSQVVIRRRPLFYTVNLLLPSIFLMVMDIVGFYLPPDSGERVSFKITLLLGYSVFLIIVSDTLPATAIGTPLIGDCDLLPLLSIFY